jgi:hypothetical protein
VDRTSLTSQVFFGAALGIIAQVLLVVGVVFYAMPWMRLALLDMARELAEFDVPGRFFRFFGARKCA